MDRIQQMDWKKFSRNFLLFAAPNLITAIIATQTNVLPMLIKNPGFLALAIVIENLVIDLVRKFIATA